MFKRFWRALAGGKHKPFISPGSLMQERIAFQFALYYLPSPSNDPIARLDTLLQDKFTSFQKAAATESAMGMMISPLMITDVKGAYRPPHPDHLQHFGHGLSRKHVEDLQSCKQVLVLSFGYPRKQVWEGLQAVTELASALARWTGGLIWDNETREMFTPDIWDKKRSGTTAEEIPNLTRHTVIHAYDKGSYVRAVTLGMIKFGLPDIVVSSFPWSLSRNIGHLVNLFAQAIAEGAEVGPSGEFILDINAIRNSEVRDPQTASLKANAAAKALLELREGTWEQGDAQNRLVEIAFDRYEGSDVYEKQVRLLESLFGWEDSLTYTMHNDDELLAASEQARERLPALKGIFNAGLSPGEFIMVKAPFETPKGGAEWMWVEVISWKGDRIRGLLKNEPFDIPGLHAGQEVEVSVDVVFDYIRRFPNGAQEGNETGKILEKYDETKTA